jgi:hypothetical protein
MVSKKSNYEDRAAPISILRQLANPDLEELRVVSFGVRIPEREPQDGSSAAAGQVSMGHWLTHTPLDKAD